jgi:hypothetical protein
MKVLFTVMLCDFYTKPKFDHLEKEIAKLTVSFLVLRNSDLPMNNRKTLMASPEKEDRYYTTRGSLGLDDNGKVLMDHVKEDRGLVWPKLFITLSSKEKEEDFMAMKGCKLPQRPKKRAKLIQKSLLVSLLVIPVRIFLFCYKN